MREVLVSRRAAARVRAGHPWIYRSDVESASGLEGGEVVRVRSGRATLGLAHYSSRSLIALRLLPEDSERLDAAYLARKFEEARAYRERLFGASETYRLVHGEGDLLPGLIVDRFGDVFAVQTLTQGMDAAKPAVVEALAEVFEPQSIVERNDVAVREREGLPRSNGPLWGEAPAEIEIEINGLRFGVDPLGGQKTGLFLDQRENYIAAGSYARGAALDCFTYHGGFALHLARRAERVEAVDSSGPALAAARRNAERNGLTNVDWREGDAFETLRLHADARRRFDTIALDPPAFAKSRRHVEPALRAYRDLNRRALNALAPHGLLISCSCSHHVSEGELLGAVAEAALDAGRKLRVIERRTQSRDHPILLTVPETHYLKCLILEAL